MPENIEIKADRQEVLDMIKNQSNKDLSNLIKDIMKDKIEKTKNIEEINKFFSELYDELYYDIIFKNIKIDKKTSRLLEGLAMPTYKKSEKEWQEVFKKIKKP